MWQVSCPVSSFPSPKTQCPSERYEGRASSFIEFRSGEENLIFFPVESTELIVEPEEQERLKMIPHSPKRR